MTDIIDTEGLNPDNYFKLVPLDQRAQAELEAEMSQQWRDRASRGEACWYEITSHLSGGGIFLQDKFSAAPLDGAQITENIPSDAIESEVRLLTIDEIQERIELDQIYSSYFDETGTVAKLPPIIKHDPWS